MKKLLTMLIAFLLIVTLYGCAQETNPNEDYCILGAKEGVYICEKRLTSYFDTTISLKLYYSVDESYNIEEIFSYFEDTVTLYHKYFDKYHEYEGITNIYTINHSNESLILDKELFDAIYFAAENESLVLSGGTPLFDIALNPVLEIWHNARESDDCIVTDGITYCPVPNDLIDEGEFNTDPNLISLNPVTYSLSFDMPDMSIDLGGMAKGYISKVIEEHLNDLGVTYLLNTGNSNVVAGGDNPNNDDGYYYIALTTPTTDYTYYGEYYMYLRVPPGLAVVTSGNYQRFFIGIDDQEIYHHIINPITNYPGGETMSITVLYEDSALADILSTAIFLLPLEDAIEFVNAFDGLEAVWYKFDGSYVYSQGFASYIYNA